MSVCVHAVAPTTRCQIFDEAKTKRPASILIALEFRNRRLSRGNTVEAYNTGTPGSATVLVLDFGLLDLSDRREQLDQVLIASRPW